MTNREYILERLSAFNVSEAFLADMGIDLTATYSGTAQVHKALVSALEELILAPTMANVSENGFSISWDRTKVGDWYLYLCRKYGITPNSDVLSLLGISMITNISDQW